LRQWYACAASSCAPAFTPKEWPERAAPRVQRIWTRVLLFMRSRAPAGISTQTLGREEDATADGSSRYRCERRPGALVAWENDKRKWYTSLEDTQALMTTKFPFIVLAWCVCRQCPAPTPKRAQILMAVGNSKIVHVFSP
jgi:hypothetical protein